MNHRFTWTWWMLGDLVSLGMIYLAYRENYPILALPACVMLFRHVVAAVNAVEKRKQRSRIATIIDEAFAESPESRPAFTLRGTLAAPGFDLVFKTPGDIRQAEQDGTLQQVMDRARALHGMHVVVEIAPE